MERFEEILIKNKFPKRTEHPQTQIAEIETAIKFTLPDDYKFFLSNYSGHEAFIGKEYVRLWDIDELLEMNNGYEILEYLPLTLAIGGNGAGEFIAIEKIGLNDLRVALAPFIGMDEREQHIEIGNSFTDFLVRLDNGREWFEEINKKSS